MRSPHNFGYINQKILQAAFLQVSAGLDGDLNTISNTFMRKNYGHLYTPVHTGSLYLLPGIQRLANTRTHASHHLRRKVRPGFSVFSHRQCRNFCCMGLWPTCNPKRYTHGHIGSEKIMREHTGLEACRSHVLAHMSMHTVTEPPTRAARVCPCAWSSPPDAHVLA